MFLNYPKVGHFRYFRSLCFKLSGGLNFRNWEQHSKTKFLHFSKLQQRFLQLKNFNQVENDPRCCHLLPAPNISGFIAQLVRALHWYREVTGSNPVEIFRSFFRFLLRNCINCVHNCEDHSLPDFILRCFHLWFISYTFVALKNLAVIPF